VIYYLRKNSERSVLGTEDDFEELKRVPRPEKFDETIASIEANTWLEAKQVLQDEGHLYGL